MAPADHRPAADEDDPRHWLGPSCLFDLDDCKLRLRVQALTQLSKTERDKALALYRFVKRMPVARRFRLGFRSAREVISAGRGDASDKATLLVAMLRIAGVPARLRYVSVDGEVLRGLLPGVRTAPRAIVEMHLDGRWARTDTYIFDAAYMAGARQRLKDSGRPCGYGIAVDGAMLWDGRSDAFVGGRPPEQDAMVVAQHGVFHQPKEFFAQAFGGRPRRLARFAHWAVLAPMMQRNIRRLREDFSPRDALGRKPS